MPVQKYKVDLSQAEREVLSELIQNEAPRSRRVKHAKILLESERGRSAAKVAEWGGVGHSTVERTRQRYAESGLEAALNDKPRPGARPKLDGNQQAFIIALACSETPNGQEKWSMQLLADKLVELGIVDEPVSHDTVGRVLKKMNSSRGSSSKWCIATVGADFVWRMADGLDCYALPIQADEPLVCIDERPCQLLADTRTPLLTKVGQPARYDYEYVRQGTCNLFMIFEPLTGWRHTTVTAHRKQEDFALLMRELVDVHYPDAQIVRVVLDNLNIHSPVFPVCDLCTCRSSPYPAQTRLSFHPKTWVMVKYGRN